MVFDVHLGYDLDVCRLCAWVMVAMEKIGAERLTFDPRLTYESASWPLLFYA